MFGLFSYRDLFYYHSGPDSDVGSVDDLPIDDEEEHSRLQFLGFNNIAESK